MNIKAGYQLTVHSDEGDGEYPQTVVLNGLSARAVEFYVELLELFSDRHGALGGTMYYEDTYVEVEEAVKYVASKYEAEYIKCDSFQDIYDSLATLLGRFQSDDHSKDSWYICALSRLEVHFFPREIVDVTADFIKQ